MPLDMRITGSYIGTNNVQAIDNSKSVGTNYDLSDMFNSQCGNGGYNSPGARNTADGAQYSPQNGDPKFFENIRKQAANNMQPGFPFFGLSPHGVPLGFPPNVSQGPQPAPAPPSPSNQGFRTPQPQQASTTPFAESVPHSQPAPAPPPPLAQRGVSDPGQQSTSVLAQTEGERPATKRNFSLSNPFRRLSPGNPFRRTRT
ncbi:hypothetical protein EYR38_006547 [Pleurotus pulmonarius]|nr:hypothetical protein EYR38_006547 [Pleurotus pulmonarius]